MADNMNGWQKLEKVQESVKDGKPAEAEKITSTITDPLSQKIFMDSLASRCSGGAEGLPSCEIVGDPGDTRAVKFKGDHPMTISRDQTGAASSLKVTDDAPSTGKKLIDGLNSAKEFLGNLPSELADGARSFVKGNTAVGEALNRANTADSELNRRWDSQIKAAEGK